MKGRRVVWPRSKEATLEEFDVPALGPSDVLIQTACSLVSPGTERAHLLALPNTPQTFPMYPGYSNVGTVLDCGSDVRHVNQGQTVFSYSPHWSHVVQKEAMVVPLPPGLDPTRAAFCSLAAVSLQAMRKAQIEIGESVGVIGQGLIGLFALQWAVIGGALTISAFDLSEPRLRLARALGATRTITVDHGSHWDIGDPPSLVIEATGNQAVIPLAFELCASRGTVVLLGSTRGLTEKVDFYTTVHKKGLTIVGAHDYIRPDSMSTQGFWTWRDDATVCLEFLKRGRLKTDPIPKREYQDGEVETLYRDLLGEQPPLAMLLRWR